MDRATALATVFSVWNSERYDELDAVMAPNFRREGPDVTTTSRDQMKEFMRQVHATYADFHIQMNASAHDGDRAFTHWTITGSLRANGKPFKVDGMTALRFDGDMLVEELAYWDTAAANKQIETEGIAHVV